MSVQNKFLAAISIFTLTLVVAMSYLFQSSASRTIQNEYFARGRILVNNLAYNARVGLIMEDLDNLEKLIQGIMRESDVDYALLFNAEGERIATSGPSLDWSEFRSLIRDKGDSMHVSSDNLAEFFAPVHLDGAVKGYALLGLSLNSLHATIASTRKTAILTACFFAILAVMGTIFLTRYVLKNLKHITAFATRLADGNHGEQVDIESKDEIGGLARSLNILSEKIAETLAKSEANFKKAEDSARAIEETHRLALAEKQQLESWVTEIVRVLEKAEKGDLREGVLVEMKGEIEQVASGLNRLFSEFSRVLHKLQQAVRAVADASNNIRQAGEHISEGANSQYQDTDSIAASIEEMATTLDSAHTSMERTASIANKAHSAAIDGGKIVKQAIKGINRIANVVDDSAKTVQSLGAQSKQISEIIQVIDEIAEQTNLLALNAAIEAARAGEQGRGFAVVADEVRKLAEKTTKATGEIAQMIQKILSLTMEAVQAMENGNSEMQSGKELVEQVGEALGEIVDAVNTMQSEFHQIVKTSREQTMAASQISDQILTIRNVAKENNDHARLLSQAGQVLEREVSSLSSLVKNFKIAEPGRRPARPASSSKPENFVGPDRRGTATAGRKELHPEGRRASDKGQLTVGPDGHISPGA